MAQVYQRKITTPKNTLDTNPLKTNIVLPNSIIKTISILFPWGHGGLTGVSIWRYARQILPNESGTWFIGNDQIIAFNTAIEIDSDPFAIEIRTYNTDSVYEHSHYITIEIDEALQSIGTPTKASEFISQLKRRAGRRK